MNKGGVVVVRSISWRENSIEISLYPDVAKEKGLLEDLVIHLHIDNQTLAQVRTGIEMMAKRVEMGKA